MAAAAQTAAKTARRTHQNSPWTAVSAAGASKRKTEPHKAACPLLLAVVFSSLLQKSLHLCPQAAEGKATAAYPKAF